jgi:eukaryotic-like serine/threonine-protein kinase
VDAEKLQKVKIIFEQALEMDASERSDFINEQCKDDDEVKNDVLSLLKISEDTTDFLEIPPSINDSGEEKPIINTTTIGKRIGKYVIEGEAGTGGMGIVYKGRRADKEFEHNVAIKILRHSINSEYVVKRFQNERQTLANLQHPNIARLLDGGTTDDGVPYLVMEYIDGVSLIDYCDEENLSIKQRLEIFRFVCDAVHYAHQNLIVHRDIKPGNVLVNKQGRPKLLDFGIAKLLDEELAEESEGLTKTGVWHLTPEYASPEQIKGERITTRSDIYSLGILLYQLLTGHQPYRITSSSPVEISKIITKELVIKPSEKFQSTEEILTSDGVTKQITPQSVSNLRNEKPDKIFQHLRGDIDNIILKAIQKDPDRRYDSVEQFSEDIRRHIVGLPVIARKDTATYRLSKFVQRHKLAFGLSSLLLLLIIVSTIAIYWQANIAADERDKARVEAKKVEQVNLFLQGMLSSVDPSEIGRDVKVYDILEKAAENIETDLIDQPEIEASIRSTLGNTYVNLGEYDKAKPFLEKALSINENIYGKESEQTAQSLHDLALYHDWAGDLKAADSLYEKSVNMFRKVLQEPTKRFADALNDYAITKMNFGQYEIAEKLYTEAIDIALSEYGEKNRNTAVMMNNLALNYTDAGNLDKAEEYHKKSLAINIELLGENRPEVGTSYNNLAYLYMLKEEYKLAEEYLEKSYNLKLNLKGEDHSDVGLALNNLGVINIRMDNYQVAETYFIDAIKQYEKTLDPEHPYIALSQYWLGKVYLETEKLDSAEEYLRKSLKTRIKKLPEGNKDIWRSKTELGICLFKQKKYREAESYLVPTLEFYKSDFSDDSEQITKLYENTINLYKAMENEQKAGEYAAQLKSFKSKTNQE